jgi:hypothetical protein
VQSGRVVNQHALEGTGCTVFQHLLELRTVIIRSGLCSVDVLRDDLQIVLDSVLLADMELPFDGLFCLHDGAVPPIKYNFLHNKNSSLKKYFKNV